MYRRCCVAPSEAKLSRRIGSAADRDRLAHPERRHPVQDQAADRQLDPFPFSPLAPSPLPMIRLYR